jgi:hypothetical protein
VFEVLPVNLEGVLGGALKLKVDCRSLGQELRLHPSERKETELDKIVAADHLDLLVW